jgi:multiple sugar transport system ATP-binding protein
MLVKNSSLDEFSVSVRDLSLKYGSLVVLENLNLDVRNGEFLVLLGASGCGKSTLLSCIAGLQDITSGQVFISGRNVTWEEPSARGIGMVFQSYALYPQMSVENNLAFGLQNARVPKDEIKRRITRAADMLQLEPLLKRKPAALSGGQRQRVAIGRALVRDVDVFLFDEPLSNLDAKLRAELRVELKRLHQSLNNTMIYVTHDQIEAMTLADRIAIMRGGVIQQLAAPLEIYNRPETLYVAGFIGSPSMNFFKGRVGDSIFHGAVTLPLSDYQFRGSTSCDEAVLGVRPEHMITGLAAEAHPNRFDATIDVIEAMGADTVLWVKIAGESVRIRVGGQVEYSIGETVAVAIDTSHSSVFDCKTEQRL